MCTFPALAEALASDSLKIDGLTVEVKSFDKDVVYQYLYYLESGHSMADMYSHLACLRVNDEDEFPMTLGDLANAEPFGKGWRLPNGHTVEFLVEDTLPELDKFL